jgi:alpha-beta hydrolase superfamily lysophospholipase
MPAFPEFVHAMASPSRALAYGTSHVKPPQITLQPLDLTMARHADHYADSSLPIFLSGHSLGGLIASTAAVRNQRMFAGLVLLSPLIDVDMTPVMRVQSLFAAPLAALMPWTRMVAAVRVEDMSEDPKVRSVVPVLLD